MENLDELNQLDFLKAVFICNSWNVIAMQIYFADSH